MLRWIDGAQERVLSAIAAGKDVYCESQGPTPPRGFTIYREPPAALRLPGVRRAWARYRDEATLSARPTQFGSWVSDRPWQAPFGDQRLGSRRYRFFTNAGRMSPPLAVGHRVAFFEDHAGSLGAAAEGALSMQPGAPSLRVFAESGRSRSVQISGMLYAIEDPVVSPRVISGEELHDAVVFDLQDWQEDLRDVSLGETDYDLRWIADVPPPLSVEFSSLNIDLPEGAAKLLRGRMVLESDGPFAFAVALVDADSQGDLIAISDPIAGVLSGFSAVARWV